MNSICRYCAEEIRPSAKVCPHCRNWLSVFSLRNPAVFIGATLAMFLIFIVGLLVSFEKLMDSGVDFFAYKDRLAVVESRMNIQALDGKDAIFVVGVVTNKSELTWQELQFDVRFYNQTGMMIDAGSSTQYWMIQPNGDSAFRVKTIPDHPVAEYASYKIYVRWAKDAKTRN